MLRYLGAVGITASCVSVPGANIYLFSDSKKRTISSLSALDSFLFNLIPGS